jgi:hypothetical protein
MELLNATEMQAGYTMGMRPDGRELLVVVVKGTFEIPKGAEQPELAKEQVPLVEADTFTGEPGLSAPIYESEYAPVKPRCDVLLLGSAYAPHGTTAHRVRVSLRIGHMHKQFDVVGNRVWRSDMFGTAATDPEPFTVMPISYDAAFGGLDNLNRDPARHEAYLANPIGRGFYPKSKGSQIDDKPLPNTEEPGKPVGSPEGTYTPMGFGPIGRAWQPRPQYAGTYDQDWIDNVFPFLPSDFDDRYYQSAPLDQQIDYLRGDEEVTLLNLTPQEETAFRLPKRDVPITFYLKNYEQKEVDAVGDTLLIEPDLGRFMILWRASLPLRKNMFEVAQVVAGRMPRGWYRARELGKTYYPSLKALVDARRAERRDAGESADQGAGEAEEESEA